ncbi:MAG: TolC family protein [Spirochaetia bacterium]|nr:TolC family protein [Spirochaetia bacterium]
MELLFYPLFPNRLNHTTNNKVIMKKLVLYIILFTTLFPLTASSFIVTKEALESALVMNNSEIITLQQQLIKGELEEKKAKMSRYGTLEASVGYSYMANPPIGPITTSTDTIFSQLTLPAGFTLGENQYITLYDGMENTLFNSELTYTLPLFTWGKINASVEMYSSLKKVYEQQLIEKRGAMNSEIASLISSLHHMQNIVNYLKEEKKIADKILTIAYDSFNVGMITSLDYKENQIEFFALDETLINTTYQRDELIQKLEKLSGVTDLDEAIIHDDIKMGEITSFVKRPLEELIEMGNRAFMPIISGLENAESASLAVYDIAKGNLYGKPDFALELSLGYGGSRVPFIEKDWFGQDDYTFNISVGMKSTLFDGGKAITEAKKAQSDIITQRAKTSEAKRNIAIEIEKYRNEIVTHQQLLSILSQKISILEEKTLLIEKEVEQGLSGEIKLLTHQLDLRNELIKKEQILLKIKIAYISLLHITTVEL